MSKASETRKRNQEQKARMDAQYAEAEKIVAKGVCPDCGEKLRHNMSILGWYQCQNFGAVGFRKDASKPSCNFQTFIRWG